ncbi:hypothetical protein JCM10212_006312 [Sporobolomyces blumeae]
MSLFGTTSSAPSFSFGAPSTSTSTSTPSLFGSTAAPASTSLFGNSNAGGAGGGGGPPSTPVNGSAPTPSPLFGGLSSGAAPAGSGQTAPKPAFSFGAPASAAPSTSSFAPAATTGAPSLFGGTQASSTATTGGGTGGLFGSTTATGGVAGQATGGLFGSKPATGGLFGNSTATPAFGAGQQQSSSTPFGQSQTAQAGQTAPQAGATSGISKSTKFQDLPDQARTVVEDLDKFIRQQGQLADELKKKNLGSEITQTGRMFDQYSAEATTVSTLLQTDSRLLSSLRASLDESLADLHKTTTLIEGFKGGPNGPKAGEAKLVGGFPFEYFKRKSEDLDQRVKRYKGTVDQIASVLTSPASSLSPSAIVPTLKAQHASLVSLAASVSALELELKRLKDEYRAIWRDKTGRMVDPFRLGVVGNGGNAVGGVEQGVRGIELR